MGYKRKAKSSYRQKLSPVAHSQFRGDFEKGVDAALARAAELQKDGWEIDLARGTLMESQAKNIQKAYKQAGIQTQMLPVATWQNEPVVLMAYKNEDGIPPVSAIKTPAPKTPKARASKFTPSTPEEVQQRFEKICGRGITNDNGFLMDPGRVMALVRRDAAPTGSVKSTMDMGRKFVNGSYRDFIDAVGRKAIIQAEKAGKQVIQFEYSGVTTDVSVKHLKKILRTLSGRLTVGWEKDSVAAFASQEGDMVLLAPSIDSDPRVVVTYNNARAGRFS